MSGSNLRKMADQWEMKRCLLRLMKRELVGGHFVRLFIPRLNRLRAAHMKGGNSNIVAYGGFNPSMSSATRNPR